MLTKNRILGLTAAALIFLADQFIKYFVNRV